MGKTKKVRKAGRLGARYGVGIRKRILKVMLPGAIRRKGPSFSH